MDLVFQLPLFILGAIQALLAVLLLLPGVSLPVAQLVSKNRKNSAINAVLGTLVVVVGGLFVSSAIELSKGAERIQRGEGRGSDLNSLATIDYLRAQVSCVLAAANLLLMFLNLALGDERRAHDHAVKNLDAMKRQVKGLQAEYERVTSAGAKGGKEGEGAAASSEADALKKQVDKLIADKAVLQREAEEAAKARMNAEARVEAMLSQIKGLDREYDRVLDENKKLTAKLAGSAAPGGGAAPAPVKKDD